MTGTSGEIPNIALTRAGQNRVSWTTSTSHRPTSAASVASRSRASLSRRRSSAVRRAVVSVQAQNMPATRPASSRTGEYEKVNHVCSSRPCRFIVSGRSSDQVGSPASAVATSGARSGQISGQTSGKGRPSAAGCLAPRISA